MKMRISMRIMVTLSVLFCSLLPQTVFGAKAPKDNVYAAAKAKGPITIDGKLDEAVWNRVPWESITQLWDGKSITSATDFSGRFKVLWSDEGSKLYVAFEATDDKFSDLTSDPLTDWWTDDCVEVFVDPDNSGGIHQYNHNAFAYHINMAGKAVDLDEDQNPFMAEPGHVDAVTLLDPSLKGVRIWEIAITLYGSYSTSRPAMNKKQSIEQGDTVGFSIAYCDNDGKKGVRESFIGWIELPTARRNDSWIDASVFGKVILGE